MCRFNSLKSCKETFSVPSDCIGAVLNDNLGLYYETYTGNGTSADWTNFCLTLRNILRTD